MIIVSGTLYVQPSTRAAFVAQSAEAVALARRTAGCRDFVVAEDPVEANRVHVYEAWDSEEALRAFRGDGPGDDLAALIVWADVREYEAVPRA